VKNLYAATTAIGLGVLSIAASRALLPQGPAAPAGASVNVTQHHNNPSRDGLFIDPAFTLSAAANLARDVNFDGTIVGNVYAQPLYVEGGPDNRAKVIAVTESNNVYALDPITGVIIWQRNVGTPAGSMGLISTVGITGTPVIDLPSRALILVAVISGPNNMIYSLNVDTGAMNPGFPIDVNASFPDFSSSLEMQRGALTLLENMVYVPYGGYADIGNYHGRVLGVSLDGSQLGSWATSSLKSGIWSPGGIASDGTNLFVATGNAPSGTTPWGGSEAIIRLQPGPFFSGSTTDYWAPTNWPALDTGDIDLGGSNPIIVDVPGATPSALVIALGKDHNAYLLDRTNLGGVSAPLAQAAVSTGFIINSATTYRTSQGTFVALRPVGGILTAFKITPTSPPTIATGWSVSSIGRTSPFVTSTDGASNPIVWAYGHGTNQRLFGYDGETGAVVFAGGGVNDTISGTRTYNTGIAARGRIYIAGDNKVYAFSVPTGPTPTPGPTASPTASPTATPTPVITPTASPVTTQTPRPTQTPTATPTPSPVPPTPSPSPGVTPSPTVQPATPTPTSSTTPAATATPAVSLPSLGNISTRLRVELGSNALIGGFILTGTQPKKVIVRAIGPSLPIGGALADPVLELRDSSGTLILANDNWRSTQETEIIATGIPPSNDLESAIVETLSANGSAYTAIVNGANSTTGVGLVEIYDLDQTVDSKLANISTRGLVQMGDSAMIAGTIVLGSGTQRVLVRAIGPSLPVDGKLADPTLELRDGNGMLIRANDNWRTDQEQEITATGIPPTDDLESALIETLPANGAAYTAIVRGVNDATGVALVEIYGLTK
jgi:hypothetical protein